MKLLLLPAAREDIEEARAWYASTAPHVQERFDAALADTTERALQLPRAFPVVYRGDLRRRLSARQAGEGRGRPPGGAGCARAAVPQGACRSRGARRRRYGSAARRRQGASAGPDRRS